MPTRFTASQLVAIAIPEQPIPIQHYLRQPQRLVRALFDPNRVQQLSEDIFRLKLRPLSFMTLSLQPAVDLKVTTESNGTIHVQSVDCEILGIEYINQRFSLNLKGYLSLEEHSTGTYLKGRADLEVKVELPPPFSFTPKAILETTGNGLLKSILLTIKQRLQYQLLADYRNWARLQTQQIGQTNDSTQLPIVTE